VLQVATRANAVSASTSALATVPCAAPPAAISRLTATALQRQHVGAACRLLVQRKEDSVAGLSTKETKDIFDQNLLKDYFDSLRYIQPKLIPDPIGPIKYDAFDRIMASYLQLMPMVAQRLDSIEAYLEQGVSEGKPYVRSEERPDVGGGALTELVETVRLLDQRLSKLESARGG
jgi:hypothetical protein